MANTQTTPTAADMMRTDLCTVRPKSSFSEAIELMVKRRVSGLPITDDQGCYLGMFSEKCCLRILHDSPDLVAPHDGTAPIAREAMVTKLVALVESDDAFVGIARLLEHRVSGAPVVDESHRFVGIFSEKTSMSVVLQSMFDGLQSAEVGRFTDRDRSRVVAETTPITEIVRTFVETEYRRLPVVTADRVVGQVSRRDVINHPHIFERVMKLDEQQSDCDRSVLAFADTTAKTIGPEMDLLSILSTFLNTPYRRLPVLDDKKQLLGQISRRDVLEALMKELRPNIQGRGTGSLYLSAINSEAPKFK